MSSNFYILVYLLLQVLILRTSARTEWIDPYSMNEESFQNRQCDNNNVLIRADIITSHFQRTLNLLLNNFAYIDETSGYKMSLAVQKDDYNFLKEFANSNMNEADWEQVDNILSKIFKKSQLDGISNILISYREYFYYKVQSQECVIILIMLSIMCLAYNLYRSNIRVMDVLKFLFLFAYIIDFGFTWITLLQEKEMEKFKSINLPRECDPQKMSSFMYLKHMLGFTKTTCDEISKYQYLDIVWMVGPIQIVGTQLGNLVHTPAEKLGSAFGIFTTNVWNHLSWYMLPIVPVILLFTLLFGCIILSFITKTSFGFNFLHLIQFNFGKEDRSKMQDMISGNNLQRVLHLLQRPVIEDVRQISPNPLHSEEVIAPNPSAVGNNPANALAQSNSGILRRRVVEDIWQISPTHLLPEDVIEPNPLAVENNTANALAQSKSEILRRPIAENIQQISPNHLLSENVIIEPCPLAAENCTAEALTQINSEVLTIGDNRNVVNNLINEEIHSTLTQT